MCGLPLELRRSSHNYESEEFRRWLDTKPLIPDLPQAVVMFFVYRTNADTIDTIEPGVLPDPNAATVAAPEKPLASASSDRCQGDAVSISVYSLN